jgi:hypothetical protein
MHAKRLQLKNLRDEQDTAFTPTKGTSKAAKKHQKVVKASAHAAKVQKLLFA